MAEAERQKNLFQDERGESPIEGLERRLAIMKLDGIGRDHREKLRVRQARAEGGSLENRR